MSSTHQGIVKVIKKIKRQAGPNWIGTGLWKEFNFLERKKFDLDVQYVEKITFISDIKIILLTVQVILSRENIDNSGEHMEEIFRIFR